MMSNSLKRLVLAAAIIIMLAIVGSLDRYRNQSTLVRLDGTPKSQSVNLIEADRAANSSTSEEITQEVSIKQTSVDKSLVKVIRVVDGDTIEIEGGEKVRYIGIDTPETVDPRKSVQCFGVEASNKNKALVAGKMISMEKDVTDRDKYNRLLRYVWVDDVFVNFELVKQGFAYSYSYPPDIKYQNDFLSAQKEAQAARRGLWSGCADKTGNTPTIVVPNTAPPAGSCNIKGNISATGEKIYHMVGCGSYEKTQIDGARGEKWFCSEAEAVTAGWRKAKNCP